MSTEVSKIEAAIKVLASHPYEEVKQAFEAVLSHVEAEVTRLETRIKQLETKPLVHSEEVITKPQPTAQDPLRTVAGEQK